jgi:hypothetical protein
MNHNTMSRQIRFPDEFFFGVADADLQLVGEDESATKGSELK